MDTTKISFGFSKLPKKPNVILNKANEKKKEDDKQLIQCLEENSIKLVNDDNKLEAPLVIPVQQNRTSTALASLKLRQAILSGNLEDEDKSAISQPGDSSKINSIQSTEGDAEESLEKRAAKEILEEIQNSKNIDKTDAQIAVPLKPDELPLDGAEEASIEDYEKIPISQFGLAMLRGMGWKDEQKKDGKIGSDQPIPRPKGMGLGADKVLKAKPLLVAPEKNEKLEIKKNAYVRVLGGKHKDLYGQIEGLDDHAGRVIVKLALGGNKESMNEFLVQPVSKGEYIKYGKVINSVKYEEYKRKQENEQKEQIQIKHEKIKEENEKRIKPEIANLKQEIKKEKHDKYHESSSSSSRRYETIDGNKSHSHKIDKRKSEGKYSKEYEKSCKQHERRRENSEESSLSSDDSSEYHYHRSKKKSKSKKEKSKNRNRKYYTDSSEENDKRHKKKTKKSKKEKARSRSRGRR